MSRNLLVFALAFFLTAGLCIYWLYSDMQKTLDTPMNLAATAYLDIRPGMSLSGIARQITEDGWIEHPYYLILEARWSDKAGSVKAGEYAIEPGTTQNMLLNKLVAGKVVQYALTVPEGLTFREIVQLLRENEHIVQQYPGADPEELAAHLGFVDSLPEGWFYPDTYYFPRGTTEIDFLHRAYRSMQKVLDEEWRNRAPALPYRTPYEALIMASLVEKETADPAERDRIAGVFVRRLQQGMRLQTDPTVIYAAGDEYNGRIRSRHLTIDSPYNTYLNKGLPPTPIAAPGRASIRAALHPAGGEELYFVSRGDGTHHFSVTLEEHNRAVHRYILNKNRPESQ